MISMALADKLKPKFETFQAMKGLTNLVGEAVQKGDNEGIAQAKQALGVYGHQINDAIAPDYFMGQPLDTSIGYAQSFTRQTIEEILGIVDGAPYEFFRGATQNGELDEKQRFGAMSQLALQLKPIDALAEGEYSDVYEAQKRAISAQAELTTDGKLDPNKYLAKFNDMPIIQQAVQAQLSKGDTSLIESYLGYYQQRVQQEFIDVDEKGKPGFNFEKLAGYLAESYSHQENKDKVPIALECSNLLFYQKPKEKAPAEGGEELAEAA